MGIAHIIQLTIGLRRKHMPSFIPGSKLIGQKLAAAAASFPALPVSPQVLASQIADVETVHLETKKTRGLIPLRTAKVDIAWNSLQNNCTYCEGICQQNPEQGLALASSSGFHVVLVGDYVKGLIEVKIDLGTGVAHLSANTKMLPPPSGKPSVAVTYLWRHSIDGLKTIVSDDPTPTAHTTITGLPLGVDVAFGVAVKDSTGTGPWSPWIPAHVH